MESEAKIAMQILAQARRGLGLGTKDAYGDALERARRVDLYIRQIEEHGRIVAWLPRVEPDGGHHHGRFAFGDALLRHRAG